MDSGGNEQRLERQGKLPVAVSMAPSKDLNMLGRRDGVDLRANKVGARYGGGAAKNGGRRYKVRKARKTAYNMKKVTKMQKQKRRTEETQ